jgi:hypothetical protein
MANEVSKLIQEFSKQFLIETKNPYNSTPNTKIITDTLPRFIRDGLKLDKKYKVYGSVGSGNWSEIPWVAILDTSISKSTTEGYYVVILFDKNMQEFYLCLSVGWTQFEQEFGTREAKIKIRTTCEYYGNLLDTKPSGFNKGLINLHAQNKLGKGYEVGVIFFKKYLISEPTDELLMDDIRQLLISYYELKMIVGDSILNLDLDTSTYDKDIKDFRKRVAVGSLSPNIEKEILKLVKIANQEPPEVMLRLKKEIVRNRKFANYVKERAHYICEICMRGPFVQKNGGPYAEADHVSPLGGKSRGLDSPDNMRCLCAQCHAIITHGSDIEIKNLFE